MSERITDRQHRDKRLVYTETMKETVREHPGLVKNAQKLIDELLEDEKQPTADDGEVHVERVGGGSVPAFKVSQGDLELFVKVENVFKGHGGSKEFHSSHVAAELLKDIPEIEVIEGQLGYSDKNHEYFVAPFKKDVVTFLSLTKTNAHLITEAEREHLVLLLRLINTRLKDFSDLSPANLFFDLKTRKILIFDLHRYSDENE